MLQYEGRPPSLRVDRELSSAGPDLIYLPNIQYINISLYTTAFLVCQVLVVPITGTGRETHMDIPVF